MTAGEFLTHSGGGVVPRVRENSRRAVSDEHVWEGEMEGTLTLHALNIPVEVFIFLVHILDYCNTIY